MVPIVKFPMVPLVEPRTYTTIRVIVVSGEVSHIRTFACAVVTRTQYSQYGHKMQYRNCLYCLLK